MNARMRRFLRSRKFQILILSTCAVFLLVSMGLAFSRSWHEHAMGTLIDGLNRCAQVTDSDTGLIACAKQTVDVQLKLHTTADLMEQITSRPLPKKYLDCHSVAHVIGAQTYKKYGDVEQAVSQCTSGCFDGCLHGVMGAAVEKQFGASDAGIDIAHMDVGQIEKIGEKYCSNLGLCHGIGHVLYTVLNDFNKADAACAAVSNGLSEENCTSGVFMQGVGDIGDALVMASTSLKGVQGPPGDYAYPCDTVPVKDRFSCFQFLWPYQKVAFNDSGITDPAEQKEIQIGTCESFSEPSRSYCFDGFGRYARVYAAAASSTDVTGYAANLCTGMPTGSDQKSCVLGYVGIQYGYHNPEAAYDLCPALTAKGLGNFCFFANFQYRDLPSVTNTDIACEYSDAKPLCAAAFNQYEKIRSALPDYRFGLYGEK